MKYLSNSSRYNLSNLLKTVLVIVITDYCRHYMKGYHRRRLYKKIECENVLEIDNNTLTCDTIFRYNGPSMTGQAVKVNGTMNITPPWGTSWGSGGPATSPPASKGPDSTATTGSAAASAAPLGTPGKGPPAKGGKGTEKGSARTHA